VDIRKVRNVADSTESVELRILFQCFLKFVGLVEVAINCLLASASDDENIVDTGLNCLFNDVLDCWLVQYGHHLLRLCLRHRQEPCAEPCRWDDRFLNVH
jgi:hypothetical protein